MLKNSRDHVQARRQLSLKPFLAGNLNFSFKNVKFMTTFRLNWVGFKHSNYIELYMITIFNYPRASINNFFFLIIIKNLQSVTLEL